MNYRIITVLALLAVSACGEPAAPPVASSDVDFSRSDEISTDAFAVVFDSSAGRSEVEVAARELCGARQWCKVFGWTDATSAARALPMTDRELEAQVFSLTINRASGMDEAVWSQAE